MVSEIVAEVNNPWQIDMFQIETIEYLFALLALLPLTALFIGIIYWKSWIRHKLGDARLVNQLLKDYSPGLFSTKIILILIAITIGILAAANIQKPIKLTSETGTGVDVMILLDVSKSMLSQDARPSRLDKAKQFLNTLLPKLENNRVGLIVFAGEAYLQMPLTPDINAARMFIANAAPDAVPVQGTVVGDALALANASLDVKENKFKTAVLITDGEDNDETAEDIARQLNGKGLFVHTIGIGSVEGANIFENGSVEPKKDLDGNIVVSKLNESLLQKVATATNGSYQRLDDVEASAASLAARINAMEKKGFTTAGKLTYNSFFPILIALALILLVLEVFIPERRKPQSA